MHVNQIIEAVDISIVICTRDRPPHLHKTLRSLASVYVPKSWRVELLIVDNGSSILTKRIAQHATLPDFDIRYVKVKRKGLSHARNIATEMARGEILLFTDDDVIVPENWVTGMTKPIRLGQADAVAGAVVLAPHLRREWHKSDPWLTSVLSTTKVLDENEPARMVGANMAIARRVFHRLPGFDTSLGAGSEFGMGEETLFSLQLQENSFRLVSAFDVVVEHHCDENRLSRESYLEIIKNIGRSQGYIDYHWKQANASPQRVIPKLALLYLKLTIKRILRYSDTQQEEGLPGWEMSLLSQIWHYRQLISEWKKPRKYNPTTPDSFVQDSYIQDEYYNGTTPRIPHYSS